MAAFSWAALWSRRRSLGHCGGKDRLTDSQGPPLRASSFSDGAPVGHGRGTGVRQALDARADRQLDAAIGPTASSPSRGPTMSFT
eukprot:7358534-Prymnesium_polylepis.1